MRRAASARPPPGCASTALQAAGHSLTSLPQVTGSTGQILAGGFVVGRAVKNDAMSDDKHSDYKQRMGFAARGDRKRWGYSETGPFSNGSNRLQLSPEGPPKRHCRGRPCSPERFREGVAKCKKGQGRIPRTCRQQRVGFAGGCPWGRAVRARRTSRADRSGRARALLMVRRPSPNQCQAQRPLTRRTSGWG